MFNASRIGNGSIYQGLQSILNQPSQVNLYYIDLFSYLLIGSKTIVYMVHGQNTKFQDRIQGSRIEYIGSMIEYKVLGQNTYLGWIEYMGSRIEYKSLGLNKGFLGRIQGSRIEYWVLGLNTRFQDRIQGYSKLDNNSSNIIKATFIHKRLLSNSIQILN